MVEQLRMMLEMKPAPDNGWYPPVIKTIAIEKQGIAELVDTFRSHHRLLLDTGGFAEHNFNLEFQFFRALVMKMATAKIFDTIRNSPFYHDILEGLKKRKIDPVTAAEQLTDRLVYKI